MDYPEEAQLASLIQAFLFAEGGTLSKRRLEQLTGANPSAIDYALKHLSGSLEGSGLTLITTESEAMLAVAKAESAALAHTYSKELGREIGDAGLEVLAIILYRGPSTRSQIDYIRGVNTSSTIRTLMSRGLITRAGGSSESREHIYRPTAELLAHIGTTAVRSLPEYDTISSELQAFESEAGPFKSEHERNNTTDTDGGASPTDPIPPYGIGDDSDAGSSAQ